MKNLSYLKGRKAFWCLIFLSAPFLHPPAHASEPAIHTFLQQQNTVSGTVSDVAGTLPGVSVSVKGKPGATLSDSKGAYRIEAYAGEILVFSFLGYATQEIAFSGSPTLDIVLVPDTRTLQEVTVNAGYYSVKDKERTGSISRVTSEDIETQPVSNVLASLQGRMAGVSVTQSTGVPGGGFSIQIRGLNSLRGTGNDPLYIVNGVPFASQPMGNSELNNGVLQSLASPLNSISPSDIESIEVLKDADATAIYGSRGANGVVLITTKKGKAGKSRLEARAATTVGRMAGRMKLLNTQQYLDMRRQAFINDGLADYPFSDYDINGTWNQTRETDWQKELIGRDAAVSSLQLSLSGGSAETQYALSGTFRNETTVFPGDARYRRAALHSSVSHQSKDDRLRIRFTADYSDDSNRLPGADLTRQAYTLAPNAPELYAADGGLNWEGGTFENPLSYLLGTYRTATQNLIANASLSYSLGHGFEAKSSFGYTDTRLSEKRTRPSTMYNPIYETTSADSQLIINSNRRSSWIAEPQVSWTHSWNKAALNVLAGATFQSLDQESLAIDGYGFPNNALINTLLAASSITVLDHGISQYRYTAFFGRLNASWDGRYIINLTGRRDGSSRFGTGNRFASFGAVGGAWIFSKEKMLEDSGTLSFGKLRASLGTTGNDQIGDYQFLDTYSVTANIYNGVTGMAPSRLFNPAFGWETNRKFEMALELGFFKDRIFLSAAFFRNLSGNQLVGIPLPGTTGFTSLQSNLNATVENRGVELELRTENIKTGTFSWASSLNLSVLRNRLLEFPGLEASTYRNNFAIGESLNITRLYQLTGIDPSTGLYTFRDFNGDGAITSSEDRQVLGDTTPDFFGGFSNSLTYKNWSLDFLFQFVRQQGQDVRAGFPIPGSFSNQPQEVLQSFPQAGATVQQYTSGSSPDAIEAFDRYVRSDAMLCDASYVRMKSLVLAYRIPALSKNCEASLYFQGQNLFTLTRYKGPDPENQSGSFLPPLRQLTLGIQLTVK